MVRRPLPALIALGVVLAAGNLDPSATHQAWAGARHRTAPDLFYNYYVPPGEGGAVGAALYPSPRPTPPLVGHTYVTYQPLMPHEFLYRHHRTYVRWHPGGGHTKTHVIWGRTLPGLHWLKKGPRPLPSPPLHAWRQ
jgi:hypothetical protein